MPGSCVNALSFGSGLGEGKTITSDSATACATASSFSSKVGAKGWWEALWPRIVAPRLWADAAFQACPWSFSPFFPFPFPFPFFPFPDEKRF